jgi:hypothetical protein
MPRPAPAPTSGSFFGQKNRVGRGEALFSQSMATPGQSPMNRNHLPGNPVLQKPLGQDQPSNQGHGSMSQAFRSLQAKPTSSLQMSTQQPNHGKTTPRQPQMNSGNRSFASAPPRYLDQVNVSTRAQDATNQQLVISQGNRRPFGRGASQQPVHSQISAHSPPPPAEPADFDLPTDLLNGGTK